MQFGDEVKDEIFLREYRLEDLEAMYRLDEACFDQAFRFDFASMKIFAGEPGAVVRIAEGAGGELVGFVIVHLEPSGGIWRGYVVTLDVAAAWRGRGVARRLMLVAETRAAAAGARWVELHVFTGNEGAVRFYERLGYERIGIKPRFYGRGLDAFVYRKTLVAAT
jgi:ribosomal-protein-alanine N-acetyltransferase